MSRSSIRRIQFEVHVDIATTSQVAALDSLDVGHSARMARPIPEIRPRQTANPTAVSSHPSTSTFGLPYRRPAPAASKTPTTVDGDNAILRLCGPLQKRVTAVNSGTSRVTYSRYLRFPGSSACGYRSWHGV